jgi:F-type H+-transporting ATPase subunit gamma
MASLKHIKSKIQSVKKTSKVTRAMEAVSAVKMRKAQQQALAARGYATTAMTILKQVSNAFSRSQHPLFMEGKGTRHALVIITSDKGLAGALNSGVLKRVAALMIEKNISPKEVDAYCIGRRGFEYAQKRGFAIAYSDTQVSDVVTTERLRELSDQLITAFTGGLLDTVHVIYTNFVSAFEQNAISRVLLPLNPKTVTEIIDGITPVKGVYAQKVVTTGSQIEYTLEGGEDAIVNSLVPLLANVAIFHALLESKASEHSARMSAMKKATDKAKEVAHDLTLKFNKARQASITREVSEITSGIEAMK